MRAPYLYEVTMPDGSVQQLRFKRDLREGFVAVFKDLDGVWRKMYKVSLCATPYPAYHNATARRIAA